MFNLSQWCRGKAYASGAGGRVFDPRPVIQKTIVVSAALLSHIVALLALRLGAWCQDKWTSITGNLPMKRRYITEQLLRST